jgi:maltose alpha-D-glucosyltransferase/alpha-amylase
VLTRDYPFAYVRGGSHLVVVNPRRDPAGADLDGISGRPATPVEAQGVRLLDGRVEVDGFGYGVFALA